jgi:putative phage-type endonuclease
MNAVLKQRSPEWHEARIGRITGSRIGAVLGHSPWQTRKALLAEMVAEATGNRVERDSPAMRWGRDHEDEALDDFLLKCASLDDELVAGGWYELGDTMGYSPDAIITQPGRGHYLVEIKCPYSRLLPDEIPPHYMDQVQLGLHVLDMRDAALHFWTPSGSETFWILRDESWIEAALPVMAEFVADYRAALLNPAAWNVEERTDVEWRQAANHYLFCIDEMKVAERELAYAKEELERLADNRPARGSGVKLEYVERAGSVDWKKLAKALAIPQETQDEYRSKPTTYARVTVARDE